MVTHVSEDHHLQEKWKCRAWASTRQDCVWGSSLYKNCPPTACTIDQRTSITPPTISPASAEEQLTEVLINCSASLLEKRNMLALMYLFKQQCSDTVGSTNRKEPFIKGTERKVEHA